MLSTTPSSTSWSQSRCSVQRLRPFGRGATGELDQARLGCAIELGQTGGLVLPFALERTRQPLHDAALAHSLDRGAADFQLLHDLLVGQYSLSAPTEAKHPRAEPIDGSEYRGAILRRHVAPGDGQPQTGLRLIQRAASALEAQARIACCGTEAFREVETHATEGATNLRAEIAIAPRDRFDQGPRLFDDVKDLIEELLAEGTVHASPGAASVTPAVHSEPFAADPVARKVRHPQAQSPLPTAPAAAAAEAEAEGRC